MLQARWLSGTMSFGILLFSVWLFDQCFDTLQALEFILLSFCLSVYLECSIFLLHKGKKKSENQRITHLSKYITWHCVLTEAVHRAKNWFVTLPCLLLHVIGLRASALVSSQQLKTFKCIFFSLWAGMYRHVAQAYSPQLEADGYVQVFPNCTCYLKSYLQSTESWYEWESPLSPSVKIYMLSSTYRL